MTKNLKHYSVVNICVHDKVKGLHQIDFHHHQRRLFNGVFATNNAMIIWLLMQLFISQITSLCIRRKLTLAHNNSALTWDSGSLSSSPLSSLQCYVCGANEHFLSSSSQTVNITDHKHPITEAPFADRCCSQVPKREWGWIQFLVPTVKK